MAHRRPRSIDYAGQFSEEQARLGAQLAALALSTAVVVDVTIAVPHGVAVDWTLVGVGGALVLVAMAYTGALLVLFRSRGTLQAPSWPVVLLSLACLASTGLANVAGDGPRGLYLPVFVTVPVFCAVSLNPAGRRLIVLATIAAVASTEWALRAHHGTAWVLAVVVYTWVVVVVDAIAGLVFGVLRARNEARANLHRLVQELTTTEDLAEGIGRCLEGLGRLLPVRARLLAVDGTGQVRRHWLPPGTPTPSDQDPSGSDPAAWTGTLADELAGRDPAVWRAATGTPVLEPSRWVLPVGYDEQGPLVLVLEHRAPLAGFARHFPKELAGTVTDAVLGGLTRLFHLERLRRDSETDPLTGLANRRRLEVELPRACALAARHQGMLCVAMADLDRFKAFNDTHGHPEGDRLLRLVAAVLASRVRASDLACRYGGDEFCLLLPATDLTGACEVLAELQRLVVAALDGTGVGMSVGVAQWDGHEPPDRLLERADQALYQAKQRGREDMVLAPSPCRAS